MSRLSFERVSPENAIGIFIYKNSNGPVSKKRAKGILIDSNIEFFFDMLPHSEDGKLNKCPVMEPDFDTVWKEGKPDDNRHYIYGFDDNLTGWYIKFNDIHIDIVEFYNLFSSSEELTSYVKLIPDIELNILVWNGIKELYKALQSYKDLFNNCYLSEIECSAKIRHFQKIHESLEFIGQAIGMEIDYPKECIEFIENLTKPRDEEECTEESDSSDNLTKE